MIVTRYPKIFGREINNYMPMVTTDNCDPEVIKAAMYYCVLKEHGNTLTDLSQEMYFREYYDDSYSFGRYSQGMSSRPMCSVFSNIGDTIDDKSWELNGFIELNKKEAPFNQAITTVTKNKTRIFVNYDAHQVYALTKKRVTDNWAQKFLASLINILKWIFPTPPQQGSDDDLFFKAYWDGDWEIIVNKLDSLYESLSLEQQLDGMKLQKFAQLCSTAQIRSLERDEESYYSSIRSREQDIKNLLDSLSDVQAKLLALRCNKEDKIPEIINFFNNHKNIQITDYRFNRTLPELTYRIEDTIEYFDVDELQRLYDNHNSFIYESPEDIRKLCYEIFINGKGVFLTHSYFKLTGTQSITPLRGSDTFYDYCPLPHPHLYNFGCLGGNEQPISKYLSQGNWDMAIEQTVAATKNINFGDSTVISRFLTFICNYRSYPFIIADNGARMTVNEFIKYMEGDEKNEQAD